MPKPRGKPQDGELCPNRLKLCENILAGDSLRVAYEATDWEAKGKDAKRNAIGIMKEPEVQAYLAARRLEIIERTGVRAERLVAELAIAAYWDPFDIVTEGVKKPEDIANLPEHVRRCITGWKWDRNGNFVLEFVDKQRAQDMLAKHLGIYQSASTNERDDPAALLKQAFWRYVISLHVHQNITISQAMNEARRDPEAVQQWGEEVGMLAAPKEAS